MAIIELKVKTTIYKLLFFLFAVARVFSQSSSEVIYTQNFDRLTGDKIPEELVVVDGKFSIKSENDNKFLELSGIPLDNFGVLFGPDVDCDVSVSAKFYSESTGKRHPSFAVGLFGISGIKLRVSPGRKAIEVLNGEKIIESAPFEWKEKKWVSVNLIVKKDKNKDRAFLTEGIVWYDGEDEKYFVKTEFSELPPKGKASVWGIPFSSKPIRFDELKVVKIRE